jgi:hypothetical protein
MFKNYSDKFNNFYHTNINIDNIVKIDYVDEYIFDRLIFYNKLKLKFKENDL